MADDPRLSRFLAAWERDQEQGITLRAVHNRLTGHIQRYDADQQQTRDRLQRVETKLEAVEKRDEREDLADALAEGTGRHRVVPTPMQAFTPAFGVQVPSDLNGHTPPTGLSPRRESGFFSSIWKTLKKRMGIGVGVIIAAGVGHWEGTCSSHSQGAQAAAERPAAPATSSPPVVPLPFDPTTRPATPNALDASSRPPPRP